MTRHRILLGLLCAALATAGTVTSASGAASSSGSSAGASRPAVGAAVPVPTDTITWHTCASVSLQQAKAQCANLSVPLDYANPTGTKISLAISRVQHTVPADQYQGVMLVNPGGPGASGLGLSTLGRFIPGGAGAAYDWIGFDPRGVGDSLPAQSCNSHYFGFDRPDYRAFTPLLKRFWAKKAARYSAACEKAQPALLDHVKTTDNANDMESIRKALGTDQINFYGFSYGTYLGQVYATLFPTRVRRMVWDGVVSPTDSFYRANLNQNAAFEITINKFFAWVARHDSIYHLGATRRAVSDRWYSLLAKAKRHPFGGKIGPDEWTDLFQSAGYYVFGWADSARLFRATARGNVRPAVRQYPDVNGTGPGSDNGFSLYLGTECTDGPYPHSAARIARDNRRSYRTAPWLTYGNAQFNGPCRTWQGRAAPAPVQIKDNGVPPILMIEETFDPATPFKGALQARSIFARSAMIEGKNGTTHAGSLNGVACTDDAIGAYLLNGTVPARQAGNRSDRTCPPVPRPQAGHSSSRSTGSLLPASIRTILERAQRRF